MAIIETKENEQEGLLQTHYYKCSYEQLKKKYLDILPKLHFNIVSIDDSYHEVFCEKGNMTVTAKIIEQTPKETSIDFYISNEGFFRPTKKSLEFIATIYKEISSVYELKGLGLHK